MLNQNYTKTYQIIRQYANLEAISSTDLDAEAVRIWVTEDPAGVNMEAGEIRIMDGDTPYSMTADYLWCPNVNRLGISWGADADWMDAASLEDGIMQWLDTQEQ